MSVPQPAVPGQAPQKRETEAHQRHRKQSAADGAGKRIARVRRYEWPSNHHRDERPRSRQHHCCNQRAQRQIQRVGGHVLDQWRRLHQFAPGAAAEGECQNQRQDSNRPGGRRTRERSPQVTGNTHPAARRGKPRNRRSRVGERRSGNRRSAANPKQVLVDQPIEFLGSGDERPLGVLQLSELLDIAAVILVQVGCKLTLPLHQLGDARQ